MPIARRRSGLSITSSSIAVTDDLASRCAPSRRTARHAAQRARPERRCLPRNVLRRREPGRAFPLCGLRVAPGDVAGDGVTAASLANDVAPFAGRVIVDRTGLPQFFDVDLKWTVDSPSGDAVGGANLPGLFTALKEQLGLRLEDARGPVEVVVVDSIATLSPN